MPATVSKKPRRKKVPKELAVIDADYCTGCESCVEICPVDCIVTIDRHAGAVGLQRWCEIDWDRCIGCKLCIRIPGKKAAPYELTVCPWDAIRMVAVGDLRSAVVGIGGPPEYIQANRERLLELAKRQLLFVEGTPR